MIPDHPDHEHVAVIFLEYHVYEKLPSGEASGKPVARKKIIQRIERKDRQNCLDSVEKLVEDFISKCQ